MEEIIRVELTGYVIESKKMDLILKNIPYALDGMVKKRITKKKNNNKIVFKKRILDIGDSVSYRKVNRKYFQRRGNRG